MNNQDLFHLLSAIQARVELCEFSKAAEAAGADLAVEIAGAISADFAGVLRKSRLESVRYQNEKLDLLVAEHQERNAEEHIERLVTLIAALGPWSPLFGNNRK